MVREAPGFDGIVFCHIHNRGGRKGWTCSSCAESPRAASPASSRPSDPKAKARGQDVEDALWEAMGAADMQAGWIRQYAWAVDEGRRFAADFGLPSARLLVEVKGGVHSIRKNSKADIEREALAAALGYRVLPLHKGMVMDGSALELIRRAVEV